MRWTSGLRAMLMAVWLVAAVGPAPAIGADLLGCSFENAADLVRQTRRPGLRILDARGGFVAGLRNYYAPPVAIRKLPPHLLDALVTSEDRRFFEHAGIDPVGLLRAAVADVRALSFAQGGSTLTQQALKNTCFQDDPAFLRKVKELIAAGDLETALGKNDILEVYLNSIFFGGTRAGIWGVQAASRVYFDKYAEDLTPLEAAVLVQLVPAPNRFNPHVAPDLARQRAVRLLDTMVAERRLSAREARKAKAQRLVFTSPATGLPGYYGGTPQRGWFAQWARSEAEEHVGGLPGVVTRMFNNYGPRQNPGSYAGIIPIVVQRVARGLPIEIHGDGGQGRDWTDGCVALTDRDMDKVFARSRVGTPVTIVGTF